MGKTRDKMGLGWNDVDLSLLVKADWNYKTEDAEKSEKLKNNIKRNGQVENLLIRELPTGFYEVVNGNHRLDVMKELGLETAHVYNFGKMSDQQARRLAIETNETRFNSDHIKLAELVKEISTEFGIDDLVQTMPYTEQEIGDMEKLLDFDFSQFKNNSPDLDPLDLKLTITYAAEDEALKAEIQNVLQRYPSAKLK